MVEKNKTYINTVSGFGANGEGVVKQDGFPVFVPYALEGEEIEYKVLKVLKSHAFGKLLKIISPSSARINPCCDVFYRCGGCSLLHIDYKKQLEIKKSNVINCFKKYSGLEVEVNDVVPCKEIYAYRNKAQYPVSGDKCGFYALRSHDIVPLKNCKIQNPNDEKILEAVLAYIKITNAPIKHIYTRYGKNECMVVLVSTSSKLKESNFLVKKLLEANKKITSIILNVNPENTNVILGKKNTTLYGKDTITAAIGNLDFEISPLSFFQVNSTQTEVLYKTAKNLAHFKTTDKIIDLYCGTGSIGLYMADSVKSVLGVEIVQDAITNAYNNAKRNNIKNAQFICGAAETVMPEIVKNEGKIDGVILDPPRKGCDESLLNCLLDTKIEKVLYISCNPATLARDLKILSEKYIPSAITPVDMFPHTSHVECVCCLTQKSQ
ncbi:MAG: 23S rRNA (uracil(1939)-C(5))-methyltransferase RlmD [Clostridia bacterium]|nr:23S rRNA (uracil(1939)-C(5))-methyltransferase RlmD [Clostridia bacterium]